jgi:hypothetical protein
MGVPFDGLQPAGADRTARERRLPRRRTRPARVQPVVQAGRLHRLHGRQACCGHPGSHPGARERVGSSGRTRLGRIGRLDPGDEQPGGRRPPRHPERGTPAQAERRTQEPASAPEELVSRGRPKGGSTTTARQSGWGRSRRSCRSRRRPSSSGGRATATSEPTSPSRTRRTFPTWSRSSACRTRPTGSTTRRLGA